MWIRVSDSLCLCLTTDRDVGHGGIVWDASLVLAWWTAHASQSLGISAQSRVLEIGAGCGLPALAVAKVSGAQVVATEKPALLPLLQVNVELNGLNVVVAPLLFGGALRKLPLPARPPFDLVLASDILGCLDDGAFDEIIKTLRDCFTANPSTVVLMSYRSRAAWEQSFFTRVAEDEGWSVHCVLEMGREELRSLKAAAFVGISQEHGGRSDAAVEMGGDEGGPGPVQIFQITAGTVAHASSSVSVSLSDQIACAC